MSRRHHITQLLHHHIPSSRTTSKPNLTHATTLPCHPTSIPRSENLLQLDEYALCKALKTTSFKHPYHAQRIHAFVIKLGFSQFTILMTALTDFQLKCGYLNEAWRLFDELPHRDVVSWTSMIVGYARHQLYKESLSTFRMMIASDIIPNAYSFSGALIACCGIQALGQGRQIHAHVLTCGLLSEDLVVQNSLLNLYSRCHSVSCARKLFDSIVLSGGNNISWNEMISGYVQCGYGEEALKLFVAMVSQGVKPDGVSYSICVDACASLASMQQGGQVHAHVVKHGFLSDIIVRNSLLNMYAKSGCVDSAKLVFDDTCLRDSLLWTAMISAYGKNGMVKEVLDTFEQMRRNNVKLDEVAYLAVLSACSHGGLVDQGWHYFRLMTEESLIPAGPEHYACMVDLLCRGGHFLKALEFIKQMPINPSISIWSSFLGSSRLYGNRELARYAAEQLLKLNPKNPTGFVTLSNTYAAESEWDETEGIRERMKNNNVKKEPACSWVETKTGYHVFLTADKSHPEMGEILLTLDGLMNTCSKDYFNRKYLGEDLFRVSNEVEVRAL